MDNIKEIIKAQISGNEAGLGWTKDNIKDIQEAREIRRECLMNQLTLNRVGFANDFNPAVAVYGESQVGKSYLVDNLLNTEKSPLTIFDGSGNKYGFIESINPIGGDKESTSLISRFTVNQRDSDKPEFSIRTVMLSPVDIVLILCDTYYNDVKRQQFPEKEQIAEMVSSIKDRYYGKKAVQDHITDVDIFELMDYLKTTEFLRGENFKDNLLASGFFETLSECIRAIGIGEWRGVFEYLWNCNPLISAVFDKLIGALQALDFERQCFIKIDPLLRKDGTILQVDRLYELFGLQEYEAAGKIVMVDTARTKDMQVYNTKRVITVQKSAFCALTAEVEFTIVEKNDTTGNSADLLEKKPFLKYMDVLDFPGARSRLEIAADQITQSETCRMLLRGKVAYLFNKYSKQYLITNLMFCHHAGKSEVSSLAGLLKGWIDTTIGRTPEERTEYIRSSGISPLFIVGTKFNLDLVRQPIDYMGTAEEKEQAMRARWVKRFNTNLLDIIHETLDNQWFSKWTTSGAFKNIYLLRAFNYSCQSGVYIGYQKRNEDGDWVDNYVNGCRREEDYSEEYKKYLPKLRETFLDSSNDFVQTHFENPEKAWDEAVSLNRDGSQWIIENLTKAAQNAHVSRELKFEKLLRDCFERLYFVLRKKYHDDNADSALKEALENAGDLKGKLDALFGRDKYFFSDFIGDMLVSEEDFHDVIMNAISSIKVLDGTDLTVLFAIRDRAMIEPDDSEEEARNKMKNVYHISSDQALDEYLKNFGFTMENIINPPKVMNIGRIIVNSVEECYFDRHLQTERFGEFVKRGLTSQTITSLFTRMRTLYNELKMNDRITEQITPHLTSPLNLDDMVDMLADVISEDFNKFVNTMGTVYFGPGLWKRLEDTVAFNKFDINLDVAVEEEVEMDEEDAKKEANIVFDLYDNVDTILNEVPVNREKLQHFSNYRTYRLWTERMEIAFLAICGVPNYDVNANNALKAIFLKRIIGVNELKPLITSKMDISCFES